MPDFQYSGNIDLNNRPKVRNPDGSISTVRSTSVNIDNKEILLPTVSDDGKNLTVQEAVQLYKTTGKHLGRFNSVQEANFAAEQIHQQQAKSMNNNQIDMSPEKYQKYHQQLISGGMKTDEADIKLLDLQAQDAMASGKSFEEIFPTYEKEAKRIREGIQEKVPDRATVTNNTVGDYAKAAVAGGLAGLGRAGADIATGLTGLVAGPEYMAKLRQQNNASFAGLENTASKNTAGAIGKMAGYAAPIIASGGTSLLGMIGASAVGSGMQGLSSRNKSSAEVGIDAAIGGAVAGVGGTAFNKLSNLVADSTLPATLNNIKGAVGTKVKATLASMSANPQIKMLADTLSNIPLVGTSSALKTTGHQVAETGQDFVDKVAKTVSGGYTGDIMKVSSDAQKAFINNPKSAGVITDVMQQPFMTDEIKQGLENAIVKSTTSISQGGVPQVLEASQKLVAKLSDPKLTPHQAWMARNDYDDALTALTNPGQGIVPLSKENAIAIKSMVRGPVEERLGQVTKAMGVGEEYHTMKQMFQYSKAYQTFSKAVGLEGGVPRAALNEFGQLNPNKLATGVGKWLDKVSKNGVVNPNLVGVVPQALVDAGQGFKALVSNNAVSINKLLNTKSSILSEGAGDKLKGMAATLGIGGLGAGGVVVGGLGGALSTSLSVATAAGTKALSFLVSSPGGLKMLQNLSKMKVGTPQFKQTSTGILTALQRYAAQPNTQPEVTSNE